MATPAPAETSLHREAMLVGGLATWETNLALGTRRWTKEAIELFGIEIEPDVDHPISEGDHLRMAMVPDDRALLDHYQRELQDTGRTEVLYRINTPNGVIELEGAGRVFSRDIDGKPTHVVSIVKNVTESRRLQRQHEVLLREAEHRSRNLVSVIGAVARSVLRNSGSLDDFSGRFFPRLHGLSRSVTAFASPGKDAVTVDDALQNQLSTLLDYPHPQVTHSGPTIELPAETLTAVTMAFHELTTNAMKHGALSDGKGRVRVDWSIEGCSSEPLLTLRWREENGPPVTKPEQEGFGSLVLKRFVEGATAGRANVEFDPGGVRWSLVMPIPKSHCGSLSMAAE